MYKRSPFDSHDGGDCPVEPNLQVLVIRRGFSDEGSPNYSNGLASDFEWHWNENESDEDIVSYRVTVDSSEADA